MQAYIGWIIGAICVGMAVWPILHLVPSTAQKRQMAFRAKAQELAIQVQIRRPHLPPELKSQYHDVATSTAYYLPNFDSKLKGSFTAIRSQNAPYDWFWIHQRPTAQWMTKMLPIYQQLPDNILAVEQYAAGSTVFWREQGDINTVLEIHIQLQRLNDLLNT
ncbi:MAG: hypothetical protein HRU20_24450 [Pseudomonadales bacterium]|nr:hypothetical protein [Pseudomonadales bacterium]